MTPMLSEVDHLIRSILPCFLDRFGMNEASETLSKLPRLDSRSAVLKAITALQIMGKPLKEKPKEPIWISIVRDVLFWSEASIITAVLDNEVDCPACVLFVKRGMDQGWLNSIEH